MDSETVTVPEPQPGLEPTPDHARTRLILDAANELLSEGGLDGLTIRAVLARTGLARRAFYERFQGKDDLVLAIFEDALRGAGHHFATVADAETDPAEALRDIVVGLVLGQASAHDSNPSGHTRRSAAFSREHLRLAESRPAELQAALRPLQEVIARQVERGIAAGRFRSCDPQLQAKLIYNLVSTTVHVELLTDDVADAGRRRQLADAIWEFCDRAISSD